MCSCRMTPSGEITGLDLWISLRRRIETVEGISPGASQRIDESRFMAAASAAIAGAAELEAVGRELTERFVALKARLLAEDWAPAADRQAAVYAVVNDRLGYHYGRDAYDHELRFMLGRLADDNVLTAWEALDVADMAIGSTVPPLVEYLKIQEFCAA